MSTVPPTTPTPTLPLSSTSGTTQLTHTPGTAHPREIKLVSHSTIFYWWPIWLLGYIMAFATFMENHRLAILPSKATIEVSKRSPDNKPEEYKLTVTGTSRQLERAVLAQEEGKSIFNTRMSQRAWMGPVYCFVLLITILITNVPLRGLWSFLVILMLVMMALIISLIPGGWEDLLSWLQNMHVYINMAGYLFLATSVLILWVVSVFIFDQRTYMIISPEQIRVCEHIGASTRIFSTTGLAFEKQRDDLFRHWILGFFSGDVIVRTFGADKQEIRFPNVLWIGWRLQQIQEILSEQKTVPVQ